MSNSTAALARSLTWAGSKQTYFTVYLMVDRPLVDDCYRAYGYFRWADDIVDDLCQSREERVSFIGHQRGLIDRLYAGERPNGLTAEEEMILAIPQKQMKGFMTSLKRGGKMYSHRDQYMAMHPDFEQPQLYKDTFKAWGLDSE